MKKILLLILGLVFLFSIVPIPAFATPQFNSNTSTYVTGTEYNQNNNYGFQMNISNVSGIYNSTEVIVFANTTFQLGRITTDTYTNYTNNTLGVIIQNDTTGMWWINFTQNQLGRAESYNFTWYANNTDDIWNSSQTHNWTLAVNSTTNVSLFLNGTEGNKSYTQNRVANITVDIKTSYTVLVNLSTNFTSTYNTSGNSPLENSITLSYTAGKYNITGFFEGDANFTSDSQTYWLTITSPPTTTTTTTTQPYSPGPPSPVASTTPGKAVVYIPLIAAASKTRVTIEKTEGVDFTEINIQVVNKVNSVYITIRKLDAKPTEIAEASGKVYHYISVVKEKIEDEDILTATMKFKVEKPWITDNDIDSATIALNRFAADKWNKLNTTKIDEDDDYIYYEAVTPGFSYFAISGEIVGAVTTTTVPATTTTTIGPTTTTTTVPLELPELTTETYIYIIVGIIIVTVLLVLWKTKILSPKKKRITHEV